MRDISQVLVSVCMITYNHERFIEQAIQSVVSQKTDFKFELIIHDDASTDGTQRIMQKYEMLYPDVIRCIYQNENQHSKGKLIRNFFIPLCQGKYYAFCEGDDFWIDDHKLQKQVDFLESHPTIPAVSARYYTVDKYNNIQATSHPGEQLNRLFSEKDALRLGAATLHLNTIMMKMSIQKSTEYSEGIEKCCLLGGHSFLIYYLCSHGGVYIMSDIMSAWRKVVEENGTSYQSRFAQHPISYSIKLVDMYCRYRTFFGEKYDFSDKIAQTALNAIVNIVEKEEKDRGKIKESMKLIKLLNFSDYINILKKYINIKRKQY